MKFATLMTLKSCAAALIVAGCSAQAETGGADSLSIRDAVAQHSELTRLNQYLAETETAPVFQAETSYTLFAPRDAAFADIDNNETLQADLAAYPDYMSDLLSYHVLEVEATEHDLDALRLRRLRGRW